MNSNKAVIVYGPQGTGKTLHAEKLMKHYGKTHVIEADGPTSRRLQVGRAFPMSALVITNDDKYARFRAEKYNEKAVFITEALHAINNRE